jgi:hypothetical protein
MRAAQNSQVLRARSIKSGQPLCQPAPNGSGEIVASGARSRDGPTPSAYASTIVIRDRSEKVRVQAANVILMRPHNWERFSFGTWLQNAAPRLHRNKLATALANKLARITWSILRNEKGLRRVPIRGDGNLTPYPSSRKRRCMERIDERIQSLVTQMVACQPVR